MRPIRGLPPGRAGRLWLRRRQATAERAAELLDVRLRLLRQERDRFTLLVDRTGEQWERTCADADRWLLRTALLGHRRAIRLADDGGRADVQLGWDAVMGVRFPAAVSITFPEHGAAASSPGTAALVETTSATRTALEAAVRYAAAAAAVRGIDAELAVTRRRLHAINDRWLPRLAAAATAARVESDEQEQAEAARLRWAAGSRGGNP